LYSSFKILQNCYHSHFIYDSKDIAHDFGYLGIDYEPSERTKRFTIYILSPKIWKKYSLTKNRGNLEHHMAPIFCHFVYQVSSTLLLLYYSPQWNKCWSLNGFWCVPSATHMQRIHQFQSTVFSRELFVIYYLIRFIMVNVCFLSAVQTEE